MEDLPLGRIAALVPEFAVKDMPLGRTLMMMMMMIMIYAKTHMRRDRNEIKYIRNNKWFLIPRPMPNI